MSFPPPIPSIRQQDQLVTVVYDEYVGIVGSDPYSFGYFDTEIGRDSPNGAIAEDERHILEVNSKICDLYIIARMHSGLPVNYNINFYEGEFPDIMMSSYYLTTINICNPEAVVRGFRTIGRFLDIKIINAIPAPDVLNLDRVKIVFRIDG